MKTPVLDSVLNKFQVYNFPVNVGKFLRIAVFIKQFRRLLLKSILNSTSKFSQKNISGGGVIDLSF